MADTKIDEATDDSERIYSEAVEMFESYAKAAADREGYLLTMAVLSQLLMAAVMLRAAKTGRTQQLCRAVQGVMRRCAPEDTARWLEVGYRMLPPSLDAAPLAQSLMISAVSRASDLTQATIATSAVSGKLAGLVMYTAKVSAEDLAARIEQAVWSVQESLDSSIIAAIPDPADPSQAN